MFLFKKLKNADTPPGKEGGIVSALVSSVKFSNTNVPMFCALTFFIDDAKRRRIKNVLTSFISYGQCFKNMKWKIEIWLCVLFFY